MWSPAAGPPPASVIARFMIVTPLAMSGCQVTHAFLSSDRCATERGADPDRWDRHTHHSSPSRQCGQQATRCHSRVRRNSVYGYRGDDDRPKGIQERDASSAWIGWSRQVHRWKGASRLDFQAGRSLSATTIGTRCNIHCRDRTHAARQVSLGNRTASGESHTLKSGRNASLLTITD